MSLLVIVAPLTIVALAFAIRVAVHAGRHPGGVDTWYYLAYADAFRLRPSFDVRLPQYLLQDERQSYPPLFPSLLALLSARWLRRWFWVVSPAIDCAHLLLLYAVTFRLTASVLVAAIASATYAFTPHLVSETRSLSSRPFGALLHSCAMLGLLKYTLSDNHWTWAAAATLTAALLFLSSAAMAAAFAFVGMMLATLFLDVRYALVPAAGLALAIALSGGHMLRVIRNYFLAIKYWRRKHRLYGRHPVRDSPVLGSALPPSTGSPLPGFLGDNLARQLLRVVGENPFLLALPLAPRLVTPWSAHLYWWAFALAGLALVATILRPLSAFGPGRAYMKAAIFPTAYTLAAGIGTPTGFARPLGRVVLLCLIVSIAAIVFFLVHVRNQPTEQTASVPAGLREAVHVLSDLPPGGVFVLPYMYADYVAYWSKKPVVWGGHCGDHTRFEWIAPVIARPLDGLFADLRVRYVLIDDRFVRLADLGLSAPLQRRAAVQGFQLFEYRGASSPLVRPLAAGGL